MLEAHDERAPPPTPHPWDRPKYSEPSSLTTSLVARSIASTVWSPLQQYCAWRAGPRAIWAINQFKLDA